MKRKDFPIAVASRSFSQNHTLRKELSEKFQDVRFNEQGKKFVNDELIEFLKGCQGAIIGLEKIDERILSALPELKVVSKYGVGLDSINLEALEKYNVKIGWAGGVNRQSVAELVVALTISLLRQITEVNRDVCEGRWNQRTGRQLADCVVGIIGCGYVGKEVAKLFRAFGCKILVHDIRDYKDFYIEHGIKPVGLEEILSSSDIVSLHIPLDETTINILDEKKLSLLRSDAYLINTARGSLVDENVLKEMLENGRLAGAAFDVFASEPPANLGLIKLKNFIATSHIGGSTIESILAMGRAAIRGLETPYTPDELRSVLQSGKIE